MILKQTPEDNFEGRHISIFLGGSIEMGSATEWQAETTKFIENNVPKEHNILISNPRRANWDKSITQSQENKDFNYQVNWELNKLNMADIIFFNLEAKTKSPISLLEIGLVAQTHRNIVICCPKNFYRRGNIEIICTRFGIPLFNSLSEAHGALLTKILSY